MRRGWRSRARWLPLALAVPVMSVHLALATLWPEDRFGLGDSAGAGARPVRIDVAFVRELQPVAAPAVPAPATRVLRGFAPRRAASATATATATAAAAAASLSGGQPPIAEEAPRLVEPTAAPLAAQALPEIAAAPELAAALVPAAAASSLETQTAAVPASAPDAAPAPVIAPSPSTRFEWPPSTRLSYLVTGYFKGPVEGQARVEWRLTGERYQVSLEVGIGPPFAPLVTRQLQSDGLVTAAGLEPRRYDEETHVVLRSSRRLSIALDAERVLLPSGREVPRPPGVQDSASQFVQMTWLFTTQPERLRAGQSVQLPLALPRHVEVWTYDVIGEARLDTPVGAIDTVHVRPRRAPRQAGAAGASGGNDLTAEFWVAPSLQYLPVRILIRQDEETYVDLVLQRLPQQAERR